MSESAGFRPACACGVGDLGRSDLPQTRPGLAESVTRRASRPQGSAGISCGCRPYPCLQPRRRDGLPGLPGTLSPLRPPVPLHDEPRGVRRGTRFRRLVAPAHWRFLRRARRPERPGKTLCDRGGEVRKCLSSSRKGISITSMTWCSPSRAALSRSGCRPWSRHGGPSRTGPRTWSRWPSSTGTAIPSDRLWSGGPD